LTDPIAVASLVELGSPSMSGFTPSTKVLATNTEPLLIAVIGLLALVIVGLVAMALVLRRRSRNQLARDARPIAPQPAVAAPAPPAIPRPRARPVVARGGGGGGLAVATSNSMVCPTCRTEYHGLTYCTRDARRLVPPEDMINAGPRGGAAKSAGLVCMACRRAYEPGLRSCPHDGNELVPFPVYNATRPRKRGATEPAGVVARICPVCATKFDLNARFCGHDAGELVVIN
jgi:uncharacterized protein YbaR (Trm112 family)